MSIVQDRPGEFIKESLDAAEMRAEEGRSRALELGQLPEEFDTETTSIEDESRGGEMARGRRFQRKY